MASITVHNLDDRLLRALRSAANERGVSIEEEVLRILRESLVGTPRGGLGSRMHGRFLDVGGADIELPRRHDKPRAPDLRFMSPSADCFMKNRCA